MIKFKANSSWQFTIEEVEVERETKDFVIINGRRDGKSTSYASYFDTFAEAWHFLNVVHIEAIRRKKEALDYAILNHNDFLTKYPNPCS